MDNILVIYGLPILGAIILLLGWYYGLTKRKMVEAKREVETKKEDKGVRALVVNLDTHVLDNEDLSEEVAEKIKAKFGSLGREEFEVARNERVYFLTKKGENYSPLLRHSDTAISPRFIGWALSVGLTLPGWFRLDTKQNQSGNLKQILWWTGIIAVIVFLAVVD